MIIQFPQVPRVRVDNPPLPRPIVLPEPRAPLALVIIAGGLLVAWAAALGMAYSQIWGGL